MCVFLGALLVVSVAATGAHPSVGAEEEQLRFEQDVDLLCLQRAYPDVVRGLEEGTDGTIWLVLHDGRKVLYADTAPVRYSSDGVPENATVRQSMADVYPLEAACAVPPQGVNPGRTRSASLFAALYGSDRGSQKLVTVRMGAEQLQVAARHGMDGAFRRVAAELERLATDPAVRPFVFPLGGAFFWRVISGTTRLSAHSYGIAIDLNPAHGAYWRWKRSRPQYAGYPQAIVELFEANGFIWGGKWNKFDLMHFEYRPELLCKAHLMQTQKPSVSGGKAVSK
ncbi:MAG: M15 family metallopeptidase [Bilophila sp.]